MYVRRPHRVTHGEICNVVGDLCFCTEIARNFTRSKAEGCEVRVECGAHNHCHVLRAEKSLSRVVLVPEAQALNEWCAVGKKNYCCVEAIRFVYLWLAFKPRPW